MRLDVTVIQRGGGMSDRPDDELLYTKEDLQRAVERITAEDNMRAYTRDDIRQTAVDLGVPPDRLEAALTVRAGRPDAEIAVRYRWPTPYKIGFISCLLACLAGFAFEFVFLRDPIFVPILKVVGTLGIIVSSLCGILFEHPVSTNPAADVRRRQKRLPSG